MIGRRPRLQVLSQLDGQRLHLIMSGVVLDWGRARHHVTLHIAAGSQCRQQRIIDPLYSRFQVGLDDTMQLETLPSGYSQRSVAVFIAQIQVIEELFCGHLSAGNRGTNHENVLLPFGSPILLFVLAMVTVVLLVDSVRFEQLFGVSTECRLCLQFFSQRTTQLVAVFLQNLDLAQLQFLRHFPSGSAVEYITEIGRFASM
jgi:hypothetical protein